jgi:hypothetical protein
MVQRPSEQQTNLNSAGNKGDEGESGNGDGTIRFVNVCLFCCVPVECLFVGCLS